MSDMRDPIPKQPDILRTGTPREVDVFLSDVLGDDSNDLTVTHVMEWTRILHSRGRAFLSHASACHYWLYERLGSNHVREAIPMQPAILLAGTTREVDVFLSNVLGDDSNGLTVRQVLEWTRILHDRGDQFVSHASACHYWLYAQLGSKHLPDQALKKS